MNRNMHSTFTVLMASSALLLGLIAASPYFPGGADAGADRAAIQPSLVTVRAIDAPALSFDPAITAGVEGVAARMTPGAELAATTAAGGKVRNTGKSRRIRQSMAMPFFSFAPRG